MDSVPLRFAHRKLLVTVALERGSKVKDTLRTGKGQDRKDKRFKQMCTCVHINEDPLSDVEPVRDET